MPNKCTLVSFADGGSAIICTRGPQSRKLNDCSICGRPARWQCDYRVSPGQTCDRFLCARHRTNIQKEMDYCPEHSRVQAPQLPGFG